MQHYYTSEEVRNMLKKECEKAGSQTAWAARHGFSLAFVNDTVRGRRDPSNAVAQTIGLVKKTVFVPASNT